jgi:hypothetical protein
MARGTFSVGLGCVLGVLAVSCGRIGYDPLDLEPDSAGGGSRADGGGGADAPIDVTVAPGSDGAIEASFEAGDASAAGDASDASDRSDGDDVVDGASLAEAGADAGVDAAPDAPPEAGYPYPSCAAGRVWSFVFDSDPTQLSWSGDGGPEWVIRGGGAFPVSELDGGVWTSAMGTTLDTRPLDPFPSRALVDVRMRSLAVSPGQHGAVVWINLNEGAPQFSALFAALGLDPDGGQTLSVWAKPGGVETALATFPGLAEALVDVHLDADPVAGTVGVWIDGASMGTYSLPQTGAPNGDEFATILSWGGTSAFQSVEIQDCVP